MEEIRRHLFRHEEQAVEALFALRTSAQQVDSALEREGLVQSSVSRNDRRNLLATLTSKGEAAVGKSIEANTSRLRAVFASLSSAELATFTALLQRVREGFASTSSDHVSGTCCSPECGCGEHVFSSRDPLTSIMMRADGVSEGDLRAI
jgi:DNA-binding MarR family transcriptional regulator